MTGLADVIGTIGRVGGVKRQRPHLCRVRVRVSVRARARVWARVRVSLG